jgi:hypothetical protein
MKQELSIAQANLKLALWDAQAKAVGSSDLYIAIQELGLPEEVNSRLHQLLTYSKTVGNKVFSIGKIILLKIIEFVKAHPFLVAGISMGATVGAAIASLITSIPFLGPLLSPIAALLGITITLFGAVIGYNLDKRFPNVGKDVVEIAQLFFSLVTDVLRSIFSDMLLPNPN